MGSELCCCSCLQELEVFPSAELEPWLFFSQKFAVLTR